MKVEIRKRPWDIEIKVDGITYIYSSDEFVYRQPTPESIYCNIVEDIKEINMIKKLVKLNKL